ncbi:MAG: cell wall hydrolase [Oscillospiraceae bacterium]|nr:cell wall hydrolase [Oscillospiraceae bacterium]
MRKVKVVAGIFCILTLGALGVVADGETYAPDASELLLEVMETPVTAAASIETTTTAPQEKLTAAVSYETAAAEETASSSLTAIQTTTASAAEITTETEVATTTVTTMTTAVITTAAPETTEAEDETDADAAGEESADESEQSEEEGESEEPTEATTESEEDEETDEEPDETEPESEEETEESEEEPSRAITITDEEYIMICNVVGHEYGANWISEYDKALVVEVIMNRVNSKLFPNTIYEVLMQKGQFPGLSRLINLGKFSKQVTPSVKAAVDLYLSDPSQFQHGYLFYSGDGHRNYFRKKA